MLKNTFRWRAQKNAAVKAKNGYKYASLPASEKKRIFEMQQIEQRDKNSKSVMKMLFSDAALTRYNVRLLP
ncbi:hypothetical protein D4040_000336 [Escherichia coli]|uniref:hypothetical protein n=1 Tax=Escherichia coli TaxID=562 RepID=UPI0011A7093E|nr:hypothetical protein [Escherichia coli]EEW9519290.1 hypothetical protein [Escherichia coli]